MNEGLLSAQQVGDRLNLTRQMVYILAARGELASVRIGRLQRFREEDVEDFIDRHREGPVPQPAA